VFINLAGAVATALNSIKIPPSGYFESGAGFVTTSAITAIGDIASNANIVTVEA
jgi:hypothetical protein